MGWLSTIATKAANSHYRSLGRVPVRELEKTDRLIPDERCRQPIEPLIAEEDMAYLRSLVDRPSDSSGSLVRGYYWDDRRASARTTT